MYIYIYTNIEITEYIGGNGNLFPPWLTAARDYEAKAA